jgi:lysozyme
MKTSLKGLVEISSHEGLCLTKYLDSVGVQTIGVGATVSEVPDIKQWRWDKKLTIPEVFDLFKKSIVKYENAINKALKVPVEQHQFDALVSICYNIGTSGASNSTFMKRINAGDTNKRIADAILMWNKPPEIMGRRKKEAKLYTTGEYGDGKVLVFPVSSTHKPQYAKGYSINALEYLQ